jgi:hypothetical protein
LISISSAHRFVVDGHVAAARAAAGSWHLNNEDLRAAQVAAAEETLTRVQALWAQLADEGRL